MKKTAFKEWSKIVEALGTKQQDIILRKGGIIEDDNQFSVKEKNFLLLPTLYHQQDEKIKASWLNLVGKEEIYYENPQQVWINFEATIIEETALTSWEEIQELNNFHVWKEEVIKERYERWKVHEITLLKIDVKPLAQPILLDLLPEYGGCKSWIEIEI